MSRRCSDLMVSAFIPGSSGLGLSPWPETLHCVLGEDTALSASLHPGGQMGSGKFNAGSSPTMDWHPIQRE